MSEWFDLLKAPMRPSARPAGPAGGTRQQTVTTVPQQQPRRRGPPTAAERQRMQQRQQQTQTSQQPVNPQRQPDYAIQERAIENPHPQYRNLGREEVEYLQQSGMTDAQIRNINNQSSTQNQVQSPTQRRLGQVYNWAAKPRARAVLGQMIRPKKTRATANVTDPNQVTVQPNPQVIQDLNNKIQQMKAEVDGNPAAKPTLEALEAQLQAEKNKGRPFSKPVAKSEWFNVLYSHQTM